jgi:magnesium transporter
MYSHSIRAILDANRNALMLLDLRFSVGTLGLAMGTFIAGLYGANLENFIEETNWGFGAVTAVSTILSIWVCVYGLRKLNSVQRVKMQGNDNVGPGIVESLSIAALGKKKKGKTSNAYHWFHDEGHVGFLDPRNREKLRRLNMMKQNNNQNKKRWW